MLPLAHIGHYLWILYLVPVLFVIGGILYSTITGRRQHRPEPDAASEQASAENAPPAGGTGREVEDVNLARRPPSP